MVDTGVLPFVEFTCVCVCVCVHVRVRPSILMSLVLLSPKKAYIMEEIWSK
jgi:hypothetical protein